MRFLNIPENDSDCIMSIAMPILMKVYGLKRVAASYSFLLMLLILFVGTDVSAQSSHFSIMSFNIRYDNPGDGDNAWDNRKEAVGKLIHKYNPNVLGLQESLKHQHEYLLKSMPHYKAVGEGREGNGKGEYTVVFIDTTVFSIADSGTFWLSKTPDVPSRSWDAALPRICTYVSLVPQDSGDTVYVYNTHFDHRGAVSRRKSASLIMEHIEGLTGGTRPCVLMGDLNENSNAEGVATIASKFEDSIDESNSSVRLVSFNGWKEYDAGAERIDYIFYQNLKLTYSIIATEKRTERLFISDHFPVYAEFKMSN